MVPNSSSLWRAGRMAAVVLLMVAPMAQSQGPSSPAGPSSPSGRIERADPLDARARVPALVYRSPLASYRPLGDDKRVDWKEANETVNRIGGWRAYAREAQQPDHAASASGTGRSTAPTSAPATASTPPSGAASGSGGHHGSHHGGRPR